MSNCLQSYGLWPARLLCPWNSPGNNTGVGCHALPQGFFRIQGLNPRLSLSLLRWQTCSLPPSPSGKSQSSWYKFFMWPSWLSEKYPSIVLQFIPSHQAPSNSITNSAQNKWSQMGESPQPPLILLRRAERSW